MCVVSLPMYDIGLQLLGVRDDSYQIDVCVVPTDSVRRPWLRRPGGCWTVHFDSHVQHYSNCRHKSQSRFTRLGLVSFKSWTWKRKFPTLNAHWLLSVLPMASIKEPGGQLTPQKWRSEYLVIIKCIDFVLQWIYYDSDPKEFAEWCHCDFRKQWCSVYGFVDTTLFTREKRIFKI